MEKIGKQKSKKPTKSLLKASTFSLRSAARPPTTPSTGKGFSGPICIVPAAARSRKPSHSDNIDLDAIMPRSPEVSCFGRVKARKALARSFSGGLHAPLPPREKKEKEKEKEKKGKVSIFKRLMSRKLDVEEGEETAATTEPCVGELRRFSSGRGTLAGFDWRVHVEVADVDDGDDEEEDGEKRK